MKTDKKNILLFNPSFGDSQMSLPYFWATAKTYYEHQGQRVDEFNWVNPLFNFYDNLTEIKKFIRDNPPDIFGISLYVWNHTMALQTAVWVREEFPNCIIISGGPHQYFKHESDWFVTNDFLDASLAGDDYGEITICDILDNYAPRTSFDWNQVHAVVYPSKSRKLILQSKKTQNKREFWWDYSAYDDQLPGMLDYKHAMAEYNPGYSLQGILETTRGCPYACTFCDWGGGTASKVIAKDLKYVKQDIEHFAMLGAEGIFLCDANLGILKERDVAVLQHIADTKKKYEKFFVIHYGGYAKTEKALPYIKQILIIEADNYLTRALTYKISLQTLDKETLKNIERTDVDFDQYLELSKFLRNTYGYDAYAEVIAGLPGINPDKFYHELSVFCKNDISMNFYDWYLLPETPSYEREYREKFKIKTVKKMYGLNQADGSYNRNFERESEIVVATYSYTEQEYKEMHISYALYRAFWTAGFLADTIKQIINQYNIEMGDFVKSFYHSFFTNSEVSGTFLSALNLTIDKTFDEFVDPTNFKTKMLFTTDYIDDADPVALIAFTIFKRLDKFRDELVEWLHHAYPLLSKKDIIKDINQTITYNNFKTKTGLIFKNYYYHEIFRDATIPSEIKDTLSVYLSSSIPVSPIHFLRAKTVIF